MIVKPVWYPVLAAAVAWSVSCTPPPQPAPPKQPSVVFIPDPTWPCGMPEGIPGPESGALVFRAQLNLERLCDIGETPYGRRQVLVVGGGVVDGPHLQGYVLRGGLDFQLTLANGVMEIEQLLVFRTRGGALIYLHNAGVGINGQDVRVVMDIEAPNNSAVEQLNRGRYVARRTVDYTAMIMQLAVYEVSDAPKVQAVKIVKPSDHPPQPWDYRVADASEQPGELILEERVALGPELSVGSSKHGIRHITPITGGEFEGRVTGVVLPGGADYRLQSDRVVRDARYLWQAKEGEIIMIRNAGTPGSLASAFEARIDGPNAWLNDGRFLSSDPEIVENTEGLHIYKSR